MSARKIPLTQGKFALVDACDYEWLRQWSWYYHVNGYVIRRRRKSDGKGPRDISMHRVILRRMGFKNFAKGDHINRNGLDNQRINLRPATNLQSGHNRGRHNSVSGYKGVNRYRSAGKWRARIMVKSESIFLGYFDSIKDAARAYNDAAIKYHGDFACLNEINQ